MTSKFGRPFSWMLSVMPGAAPPDQDITVGFVFGQVFFFFPPSGLGVRLCEARALRGPLVSEQGAGQHQNLAGRPTHTGSFRCAAGHFVPLLNSGRGVREASFCGQITWYPVVREEGWTWEKRVWKADTINRGFLLTPRILWSSVKLRFKIFLVYWMRIAVLGGISR